MIHVALVGAAVLAGGGLAALGARLAPRLRLAVESLVLALVLFECWSPANPTLAVPASGADPVYAWLARQPRGMRLAEVPVDEFAVANSVYQYTSTFHWHPMLNGNMGIVPPMFPYLARRLARLPADDVVADLATLGITHVLHHGPAPLPASRHLKLRWRSARSRVYAIRPGVRAARRAPAGRPLARRGWVATATAGADRAALAVDDDVTSAWSSWIDVERAVRSWRWDAATPLARWADFLRAQPVRFTVDLGAPTAVTAVVARLGGSDPLALAALAVEGSDDGERWEPLPGGLEPLPDALGLVRHAAEARMALLLPAPRTLRAIRLSCRTFEWHLADLAVYGPDASAGPAMRGRAQPITPGVRVHAAGPRARSRRSTGRPAHGERSRVTAPQRRSRGRPAGSTSDSHSSRSTPPARTATAKCACVPAGVSHSSGSTPNPVSNRVPWSGTTA
jgi:hypothetical protein